MSGTACTPAAQITVLDSIRSLASPTSIVTPCESMAVARAPSRTVTPSSFSPVATFAESFSLNDATSRSPASSRITRTAAGLLRLKPCFIVRAVRASCPATSTPVGPPPMTTNVAHSVRVASSRARSASSKAANTRLRSSSTSASVFSPHETSFHSSWPK